MRVIEFRRSEPAELIGQMRQLAESGRGWVNLVADVDDAPPPPSGLGALFGASGPAVPFLTWTAPGRGRRGPTAASVGIQHASGTKARIRLRDGGCAVPSEWRVRQDHPKRGLVAELPAEVDAKVALAWLFAASDVLTRVPLGDRWLAEIHDI
ncbi:MAG: hypothetical protein OEY23_19550 [Acidimicrobiia bacterium]|nr:hypothetical protein [Acidimicrobiia bacterium]